jgi:hypothetical protein
VAASTVLELVKARLGISTDVRDAYLTSIIQSVVEELEEQQGIKIDNENIIHTMFIVDYATWRYQSRDSSGAMPRHLQWRLHNLIISGDNDVQP